MYHQRHEYLLCDDCVTFYRIIYFSRFCQIRRLNCMEPKEMWKTVVIWLVFASKTQFPKKNLVLVAHVVVFRASVVIYR